MNVHGKDTNTGVPQPEVRDTPYQFHGKFYEACDCYTICPCWTGNQPDEGVCTGVFAWGLEGGSIRGVDVTGRRVVSISQHTGHRDAALQRVVIFVDEDASAEQTEALVGALSGRYGGPLWELADLLGELLGVERAAIRLDREGVRTRLTVGSGVRVESTLNKGPSGRTTTLADGRLSNVLGSPAEVGVSSRFHIGLPVHAIDLDLRDRSTMSGKFSYEHAPTGG